MRGRHPDSLAHAFTDGRDTPPRSAGDDIARFAAALPASVPDRDGERAAAYAMDRDKRWERVAKAYAAIVAGDAPHASRMPQRWSRTRTLHDMNDEFVLPAVIGDYRGMRDGDGVLCFNFRADRVREILLALLDPKFSGFARPRTVALAAAAGMTPYGDRLTHFMSAIFPHDDLTKVLGEIVADEPRAAGADGGDREIPARRRFLSGGREEHCPRRRGPHPWCPRPGGDLRPAAEDVGAGSCLTDKAVAAIDSGQVRPDRAELRQP